MECEFSFICDSAQQAGNKLYALGIGWDTIYAPSVPIRHTQMAFVTRLRASVAEAGTQDVTIRIIDADGEDVLPPIVQQLSLEIPPPAVHGNLNIVANLGGLEMKKFGAYAIHLVVNKVEMARIGFSITPPPTTV